MVRYDLSVFAKLCVFAIRQVSKCSSHSNGGFVETTIGRSWPTAEVDPYMANGRNGRLV